MFFALFQGLGSQYKSFEDTWRCISKLTLTNNFSELTSFLDLLIWEEKLSLQLSINHIKGESGPTIHYRTNHDRKVLCSIINKGNPIWHFPIKKK